MPKETETCIQGRVCSLVPYAKDTVPKYHAWMQSPELLYLTGSLPLTLEEEYGVHESWSSDPNKITFLISLPGNFETRKEAIDHLVGDVNLYISETEDLQNQGEIEVMIAESSARRKGIASEALQLMMNYAKTAHNISEFIAKIKMDNKPSITMFERLGFSLHQKNEIFEEVVYRKALD
jgi:RimJ/RimL family protein N-acetyltransferase